MSHAAAIAAVGDVLTAYFDGLHHSDAARLGDVFHPAALYATASDGQLVTRTMAEYLPIVDARPSPASRGQERTDRVLGIQLVGPVTAVATVECSIAPLDFTDVLTLVHVDGRWQIISKVFHHERRGAATCRT